ncbi:urease accessory protein UreF [Branchiibius sp. NY16-3462-2]|uniref:urease accessory protein UreF n=1 Tax=Branchiibius sp. NY16-3462-2 TaxID=1807500 RepID=UPI0007914CE5|nr:urease accessory UreF family protein [Branchiibius sp. NY16-3462-2]KYH42900.1 urease accessory protein [Branchiibius sp. NY16-3462-2]
MSDPGSPSDVGQLLFSLQLADSAFPSGLYTMSHGLEGFRQRGLVTPDDVGDLLADLLRCSIGPADATALARAHDAARAGDLQEVQRIDRLLFATKLNGELRAASVRSGRQLMRTAGALVDDPIVSAYGDLVRSRDVPGCQPVVSGICYAAAGVSVERAVASDLFAFASSFTGAALRLRLADHVAAQVILREVAPVVEEVAASAVVRPTEDIGGFAPMTDICSAGHERAEARLFTT